MTSNHDYSERMERNGPTDEYAKQQHVKPQTVRKRYSKTGSYFGTRPRKLPNGRLSWPLQGNGQ